MRGDKNKTEKVTSDLLTPRLVSDRKASDFVKLQCGVASHVGKTHIAAFKKIHADGWTETSTQTHTAQNGHRQPPPPPRAGCLLRVPCRAGM